MDNKLSVLVSRKSVLKGTFNKEEFNSSCKIYYAETKQEIFAFLEKYHISIVVLDEEFVLQSENSIVKEIENKIILNNALNDTITVMIPVIAITKNNSVEIQQKLYNLKIFECFLENIPPENLSLCIKHLAERFAIEQRHVTISHEQQRQTIRQLVQRDKKTGIYNKQTFLAKTQKMLNENPGKKYILILMNLDRFKVFNDLFGFSNGDRILEQIGYNLSHSISDNSTYGHIYADHFVVCTKMLSEARLKEIFKNAEPYIKALHPKFEFVMRYGIYKIGSSDEDVSIALDRAELALSSIKQDFTKRYAFYNDSMIEDLKEEQELITDMVEGIKNDEFTVYFQPQYDYTTESLVGAEALVRWNHPEKGLLSPALFVPVFERNGFISQLDQIIWEKTCWYLNRWKRQGLNPVPVSVNISRRDIYEYDLVKIFNSLLAKYDLSPEMLRLEITESAYMDNPSQLIEVVENLRKNGFCLEMDDFGSGYSSLNTLKEVPVDILKLDMKFISSDTETHSETEAVRGGSILSSVVRMANWLHLPVIAEGIESKTQADYLKSIGCFHMQGFYFSKPIPPEAYEALLVELCPVSEDCVEDLKTEEIDSFLNASSQTAMLFNSFIGGAAIIEWQGETVEALRMNDKFFEELGTNRHDFIEMDKNLIPSIVPSYKSVFLTTLQEVKTNKKPDFCEIQIKPFYKGTNPFWIRVHIRHIGHTIISDIYYIAIENIDFRMQLLQLSTNLSEQLKTIMENVPCGIVTVTFGEKVQITFSNEAAAKLLGYSPNEFNALCSQDPFIFFDEADRGPIKEIVRNASFSESKTFVKRMKVYRKDGSQLEVQLCGNIYELSDGTKKSNILFMDVCEVSLSEQIFNSVQAEVNVKK